MSPRYAYTRPELLLMSKMIENNIRFQTQFPILVKKYKKYYIVDFLIENKLIVEVDGVKHRTSLNRIKKDKIRDKALRAKGYNILRIPDYEILNNIDEVIKKIKKKIMKINS
jgi:very-short-patch-repair endonuclease